MARSLSKIASGLILTTVSLHVSFAEEQKFDHKLEAAMIAKVADKIGALRGTIDFQKTAEIITANKATTKPKPVEQNNWVAPKPRKEHSNRVSSMEVDIDPFKTNSIAAPTKVAVKQFKWDKFDRYGNPLNFVR